MSVWYIKIIHQEGISLSVSGCHRLGVTCSHFRFVMFSLSICSFHFFLTELAWFVWYSQLFLRYSTHGVSTWLNYEQENKIKNIQFHLMQWHQCWLVSGIKTTFYPLFSSGVCSLNENEGRVNFKVFLKVIFQMINTLKSKWIHHCAWQPLLL